MIVSLTEIKNMFTDLVNEKKSREEIAYWALQRQIANDADDLTFEPTSETKKIWRCIIYLMGVDLKDIDGSYFTLKI